MYLTTRRVGEILQISPTLVVRYIKAGQFPGAFPMSPHLVKTRWMIPEADVAAFDKRRKEKAVGRSREGE